jgi:hypothetical protein
LFRLLVRRLRVPGGWTIADLPGPMAEWESWFIIACVGGAGAYAWKR